MQNLGAEKPERVKEIFRYSNILTILIASIATIAIFFFPDLWVRIFTPDLQVREMGSTYLKIVSLSYVVFSLMFSTGGISRGAGDTLITMAITLLSLWGIRLPLAKVLSETLGLGPTGIFLAIAISPVFGLALNLIYYYSGRWKTRNLVKRNVQSDTGN